MAQAQTVFEESQEVTEEACWRAVMARDAAFDGLFFYGVRSTGIFCKPSCPSRLPKRERVAFFLSQEEARAAGFRPCLRCRPQSADEPHTQAGPGRG